MRRGLPGAEGEIAGIVVHRPHPETPRQGRMSALFFFDLSGGFSAGNGIAAANINHLSRRVINGARLNVN